MKNKLLSIIMVILFVFAINSICFADNENKNLITSDFELNSYSSINNEIEYGSDLKKDGETILLSIKAKDYNLPSNLYTYKDDILLRITYSQDDYKVYDCKVINNRTGEIIEDLSEENINKLFNIEYGKNITEKAWSSTIKLSELKENVIYKYTANSTTQFPKIENDIGKNCVVYIKENDDKNYDKEINMYKNISGSGLSLSFNEYNSGDTFNIMYEILENNELLNSVPKDEIIYLSNYKDGDELKYEFEKYIYNDTEKNITIYTKDTAFEIESSNSVIIGKGEIYGFDWMIDSAIISYSTDNNQGIDNNIGSNQTEPTIKDTNNIVDIKNNTDNVTSSSKLPQTGISDSILVAIFSSIIIMIIIGIKLRKFKDIK